MSSSLSVQVNMLGLYILNVKTTSIFLWVAFGEGLAKLDPLPSLSYVGKWIATTPPYHNSILGNLVHFPLAKVEH